MGLIRNIFLGVLAVIIVLVGIVVFRTFTYGGALDTAEVELPEPPAVSADAAAARLSQALQFRTITVAPGDPRAGNEAPWLELHDWLATTYPSAHQVMTREMVAGYTLLYTWPGSDASLDPLLLMAHQDVVPVNIGTEGDWTGSPFGGEIIEGYVYGRGAIDDKGSLVALMEAAEALARDGFQPRRTILFLFGHDEEVSGSGAGAGVELLRSRAVAPVMALDEGFMVLDPSPLTGAPMGFIGIAEKGFLSVRATALAQGGHSSTPPRNSATVRLSRLLVELDDNQMPADMKGEIVTGLLRASAPEMDLMPRMALANQWLFGGMVKAQMGAIPPANAMIRTTTAPTMLVGSSKDNVLAQRASAVINFRIHPSNTEEDVLDHVRRASEKVGGEWEIEAAREGIRGKGASPVSPIDNRPYAVLAAVARQTGAGAQVAPGLVLGATDGRYATAITDSVYRFAPSMMSPEDLTGFHGTNERLSVENMGRLSRGYAQIIMAMDAGD